MSTSSDQEPKDTKVLEFKQDTTLRIMFLLIVAGIVAAAVLHRISPEVAAALIAALGFPSVLGQKAIPAVLLQGLLAELQKQLTASLPPPPPPPPPPTTPTVVVVAVPAAPEPTTDIADLPPKE